MRLCVIVYIYDEQTRNNKKAKNHLHFSMSIQNSLCILICLISHFILGRAHIYLRLWNMHRIWHHGPKIVSSWMWCKISHWNTKKKKSIGQFTSFFFLHSPFLVYMFSFFLFLCYLVSRFFFCVFFYIIQMHTLRSFDTMKTTIK